MIDGEIIGYIRENVDINKITIGEIHETWRGRKVELMYGHKHIGFYGYKTNNCLGTKTHGFAYSSRYACGTCVFLFFASANLCPVGAISFVKGRETTREKAQRIIKENKILLKVKEELEKRKEELSMNKK